VLLPAVVAACGSDDSGGSAGAAGGDGGGLEKIRVGVIPFQDVYPLLFAKEKGWFKEAGLDPEFKDFEFFPDATVGLASGAVDIAPTEVASILPTVEQFPQLRLAVPIHVFDNGFGLMVRKDSGLKTYEQLLDENGGDEAAAGRAAAAQLKGKELIVPANTDQETSAYAVAKLGGLQWDDIKKIDLNPNEGATAFLSGTGDALMAGIPQRLATRKRGAVELLTGAQMGPGSVPLVAFATTDEYYKAHEDTLKKFFSVWTRLSSYAAESTENAREVGGHVADLLNQKTGADLTPDDFVTLFNNWQHFPPNVSEWKKWYGKISPADRWQVAGEFFVDVKKNVKQLPDFDQYIWLNKFLDSYESTYGADK
jgi:ABC-type nitrate/sulfonate/bicarbonate transport system substrate-binding protein